MSAWLEAMAGLARPFEVRLTGVNADEWIETVDEAKAALEELNRLHGTKLELVAIIDANDSIFQVMGEHEAAIEEGCLVGERYYLEVVHERGGYYW